MRYSEKGIDAAANAIAADMTDPLTSNMICAGTTSGVRDACNGDSGGPLFMTGADGPVQVGVVSWGEGPADGSAACGHKDAYGIYTRLANYTGWIEAKMKTPAPAPRKTQGRTRHCPEAEDALNTVISLDNEKTAGDVPAVFSLPACSSA